MATLFTISGLMMYNVNPPHEIRSNAKARDELIMIVTVQIKPLSSNRAWQGRRFKSDEYKAYEKELLFRLPAMKMPEPPYSFYYEFGFSNMASDIDNPVKSLTDVLCKKYQFNDKLIHDMRIRKVKVSKGQEYFTVIVESIV